MDESTSYLKGHFLMAMPTLMDPNFRKSVTCISEHTDEGAVGIVVNQVHDGLTAAMVFDELGIEDRMQAESVPIHMGGPVHTNQLFVLHGVPLDWGGSLIVNEHLALSNSRDIIEAIARREGPRAFIIALGCAGWGPGQLEWELSQNAWLMTACDLDIIFNVPLEKRWENAIRNIGIDPGQLSDMGGNA